MKMQAKKAKDREGTTTVINKMAATNSKVATVSSKVVIASSKAAIASSRVATNSKAAIAGNRVAIASSKVAIASNKAVIARNKADLKNARKINLANKCDSCHVHSPWNMWNPSSIPQQKFV